MISISLCFWYILSNISSLRQCPNRFTHDSHRKSSTVHFRPSDVDKEDDDERADSTDSSHRKAVAFKGNQEADENENISKDDDNKSSEGRPPRNKMDSIQDDSYSMTQQKAAEYKQNHQESDDENTEIESDDDDDIEMESSDMDGDIESSEPEHTQRKSVEYRQNQGTRGSSSVLFDEDGKDSEEEESMRERRESRDHNRNLDDDDDEEDIEEESQSGSSSETESQEKSMAELALEHMDDDDGTEGDSSHLAYGLMGSCYVERLDHSVSIVIEGDDVIITLKGRSDSWFGFGFDSSTMEGTYAIIASDEGVKEYLLRKMTLDQSENEVIPNGIRVHKDEVIGEHRIVEVSRPRNLDHFAFPEEQRTISIIYAKGSGPQQLGYHGYDNRGS